MSDTISKLNELKLRFEELYEIKIKDINSEKLMKACLDYLDYDKTAPEFGQTEDSKGNAAMRVNDFVRNSTNIQEYYPSQTLDLNGIIELLDKKIESLNKDKQS